MEIHIETPRFIIRELRPEDEAGMFIMDSDPEVHKYVGQKPVQSPAQIGEVIQFVRQQYVDNGVGRWAIEEKSSGEFVGWTGFKLMREKINDCINFYDFGYRLRRASWGRGVATETGRAALDFGIPYLGLTDVYAMTDVNNLASRRVLEKLGFRYVKTFGYDAEPTWRSVQEPTTWYEMKVGVNQIE